MAGELLRAAKRDEDNDTDAELGWTLFGEFVVSVIAIARGLSGK